MDSSERDRLVPEGVRLGEEDVDEERPINSIEWIICEIKPFVVAAQKMLAAAIKHTSFCVFSRDYYINVP